MPRQARLMNGGGRNSLPSLTLRRGPLGCVVGILCGMNPGKQAPTKFSVSLPACSTMNCGD
jgi:hypothetical protein